MSATRYFQKVIDLFLPHPRTGKNISHSNGNDKEFLSLNLRSSKKEVRIIKIKKS
jgi:hypothetical protein